MSEENEAGVKLCPVCEKFEPQAWRKSMCRNCFHSNEEHLVVINGADTGTSTVNELKSEDDKTPVITPKSPAKNDRINKTKDKVTPLQDKTDESRFGTWPRVSKRSSGTEETDSKLLKDKDDVSVDKGTGVKANLETTGKLAAPQKTEVGKDKCDSTSDKKRLLAEKFGKRLTGESTQIHIDNSKPLKKDPKSMKFDELTTSKSSNSNAALKLGSKTKDDFEKAKDKISNDAKTLRQTFPVLSKDKISASKKISDDAKTETYSAPLKSKFSSEDSKPPIKSFTPSISSDSSLKSPLTEQKSVVPPKPAKKPEKKAPEQAAPSQKKTFEQAPPSQKDTEQASSKKDSAVLSLIAGSKFDKNRQDKKQSQITSKFSTASEKTSSLTSKFEAIGAKKCDDKKKISETPSDFKKTNIDSAGKNMKKEVEELTLDGKNDKQKISETKYGKFNFTKDLKKRTDSGSERKVENNSPQHIPPNTKSQTELKKVTQDTKTERKEKIERKDRQCDVNKDIDGGQRGSSTKNNTEVHDSGDVLKKNIENEEAKHDSTYNTKVKVTDSEKNKTKTTSIKEKSDIKPKFELKSDKESKLDSNDDKKNRTTGDIQKKFGNRQGPAALEPKSPSHGAPFGGKMVFTANDGSGKGESNARAVGKQMDSGNQSSPKAEQVFTNKRAAGGEQKQTLTAELSSSRSDDEKSKRGYKTPGSDTEILGTQKLDQDAEKLQAELSAMAERCKHLEDENEKLRTGLTHKDRTQSELMAQKHEVETTINALQDQLRSMEVRCVKLEGDNSSLLGNIKASQEENQGKPGSEESVALLEKLKTREDLCEELVDENDTLKQEIVDLRVEMDEMYDSFRDQEAEEFRELQKELEITAKNCRILQFKLRKAERRNEQVENERVQYAEKLRLLQNQFESDDARAHIVSLEDELNMAKEVSVRLHDELDMVEEKRAKMETENRHLTELLEQADRKQFRLEMEVDKLRDQIHDLKHDMAKGSVDDSAGKDVKRIYSVLRPIDP